MTVSLREAKEQLIALVRDEPGFMGCGLGVNGIRILWVDDDHDVVPKKFKGHNVEVMVTGVIVAQGDETSEGQ